MISGTGLFPRKVEVSGKDVVIANETCSCDHLRTQHCDRFSPGHGPCAQEGCGCAQFTWSAWVMGTGSPVVDKALSEVGVVSEGDLAAESKRVEEVFNLSERLANAYKALEMANKEAGKRFALERTISVLKEEIERLTTKVIAVRAGKRSILVDG